MIWLFLLLLTITAVILYLLFAPFILYINSDEGVYRIRFHKLASVSYVAHNGKPGLEIRIAGWRKRVSHVSFMAKKSEPQKKVQKPSKPRMTFNRVLAVIKTFRISRFYVSIDTGNAQANGVLYPTLYAWGQYAHRHAEINFLNRNTVILEIKNTMARVIKAFLFS